jgi:hypothetical protein
MDFRKHGLSIEQAKEMDMVEYLSLLGHQPALVRGNNYWYHSPMRDEKTPSFTVNRKRNIWYDFGLGKGGTIIDFGMLYHKTTIPDFLQLLSDGNASLILPVISHRPKQKESEQSRIKILQVTDVSTPSLLSYFGQRGVPMPIAGKYCKEVRFESKGKNYFGIGFENDSGGYEIRNAYFKGSSSPKDITTLENGSDRIAVFEGFFDFLSYKILQNKTGKPETDYLILNSLSFFEKSLAALSGYKNVHLYLDNNNSGQKCVQMALAQSDRFTDERSLYKGFEDLNDFLLARKSAPVKVRRKGLRPG